jgi:hypothetical protein
MTPLEYVNVLVWPGHLGATLAVTARTIVAPVPGQAPYNRERWQLAWLAERYGHSDGWESKPWLEIRVRLARLGCAAPPREQTLLVTADGALEPIVRDIHAIAVGLLEAELFATARAHGPVWISEDAEPNLDRRCLARWLGPT